MLVADLQIKNGMTFTQKNMTLKSLFINILHALIDKILFYAIQYEQPLHQVGIEPVASGVQGAHLNRFTTEFCKIIRVSMVLDQTKHDMPI